MCKHKIYLETNATLPDKLKQIIDYVDIVAADIKLETSTGKSMPYHLHDEFFEIAAKKHLFIKVVFSSNITDDEIRKSCDLAKRYNVELILQPVMNNRGFAVDIKTIEKIFDKFTKIYPNSRLIPQMHKFLNVR